MSGKSENRRSERVFGGAAGILDVGKSEAPNRGRVRGFRPTPIQSRTRSKQMKSTHTGSCTAIGGAE